MPGFTFDVDMTSLVAGLYEIEKKQLPFAVAKTLTACAKAAQSALKEDVAPGSHAPMIIRSPWTERNIKIAPADKDTLPMQARVTADTANERAPDYLGQQDRGGEKVPHKGNTHIAVPTQYLYGLIGGKDSIIPDELRARNLLGAVAGRYIRVKRSGRDKGRTALTRQRIVRGYEFFLDTRDGHDSIMGHLVKSMTLHPFYWLIPEAKLRAVFPFEKTCETAAIQRWQDLWEKTWRDIHVKGLRV